MSKKGRYAIGKGLIWLETLSLPPLVQKIIKKPLNALAEVGYDYVEKEI